MIDLSFSLQRPLFHDLERDHVVEKHQLEASQDTDHRWFVTTHRRQTQPMMLGAS